MAPWPLTRSTILVCTSKSTEQVLLERTSSAMYERSYSKKENLLCPKEEERKIITHLNYFYLTKGQDGEMRIDTKEEEERTKSTVDRRE